MNSVSYFNIKLLCAVSILSASLAHAADVPAVPAQITTQPAMVSEALLEKTIAHIAQQNTKMVDDMRKQIRNHKRANLLLVTGIAAYIAHKHGADIAATLEEKWVALKDQCSSWYGNVTTMTTEEATDNQTQNK